MGLGALHRPLTSAMADADFVRVIVDESLGVSALRTERLRFACLL